MPARARVSRPAVNGGHREAEKLERLWSGRFGDAYTDRNASATNLREPFWRHVMQLAPAASVLEVGCNIGANLRWIRAARPDALLAGLDVNRTALQRMCGDLPDVHAVVGTARTLPIRDRSFDLVFTVGVLIHQPEESLSAVIDEIVRCARRWIVCAEYYSARPVEVTYRGERGALFKRDYGRLYLDRHPGLTPRDQGFLSRTDGWDDVTYWLFERR